MVAALAPVFFPHDALAVVQQRQDREQREDRDQRQPPAAGHVADQGKDAKGNPADQEQGRELDQHLGGKEHDEGRALGRPQVILSPAPGLDKHADEADAVKDGAQDAVDLIGN